MGQKLVSYKQLSKNEGIVMFELEIEKTEIIWFREVTKTHFRKGYWDGKFSLCFYCDTGEIIHCFGESIIMTIKSGHEIFKFKS